MVNAPAATETVTYLHSDTLGNVIGESKADGSFTRYHYKPYGERVESAPERLGFTGHLHQKELGLTYMQARHFDPLMGRFYGNDPQGFDAGNPFSFNRYGYGNNNPYKYSDPNGEWVQIVAGAISGAVGGAITGYASQGWSGAFKGAAIGAVVGGAVGVLNPLGSHASATASVAAAMGTNALASMAGQVAGNAVNGQPHNANLSATAVVGAALGGGVGAAIGNAVGTVGPQVAPVVIGSSLTINTAPVAIGTLGTKAVLEGSLSGAGELVGQKLGGQNSTVNGNQQSQSYQKQPEPEKKEEQP